jgi:ribosomal-protein-alanine N-acetyltransferase
MREDDIGAVAVIEAANFSMPWSAKGFYDALTQYGGIFFVAECDGCVAGYIGMTVAADEGEITQVSIDERYRRQGVAGALMEKLLRDVSQRGVTSIVLEVRVSNEPAIKLYKKYGFKSAGIRKGFYELPREDAEIMIYNI